MKRYAVYGLGAALVDCELAVSEETLATLGLSRGMRTLANEAQLRAIEDRLGGEMRGARRASGGSVANSLIAVARFGAPAFLSCRVAADADGDRFLADLAAAGVACPPRRPDGRGRTGRCLVLVTPDAERTLVTCPGVAEALTDADIDAGDLAVSECLYIEGFLLGSAAGRAAAQRARALAAAAAVPVILNLSDADLVDRHRQAIAGLVGDGVDTVICNAGEARRFTGAGDLAGAASRLRRTARRFAITSGAEGALCFDGEREHAVPAQRVAAADSNGAGDLFAGALLYALARGEDFATAGRFACLAASRGVARHGPRLPAGDYAALRREFFRA